MALGDKRPRLAAADESEILETVDGQVGEGVVDHQMIDIVVTDAGGRERPRPGDPERRRGGEIVHLADQRCFAALSGSADVDRGPAQVASPVGPGQHQGAATVGDQAAHQQPERVADHPGVQHVVDRDRIAETGTGIETGPFALHDRDHRQRLLGQGVLLHVAQHRDGEHGRRPGHPVGPFELLLEQRGEDRRAVPAEPGASALAVGDQDGGAQPLVDRGGGVAHQQHEGTTPDRGPVQPLGHDAEVVRDLDRVVTAGRNAVDVAELEPGIGDRVERRVGVELDLRHGRDLAELGGFRSADDGNGVGLHLTPPGPA